MKLDSGASDTIDHFVIHLHSSVEETVSRILCTSGCFTSWEVVFWLRMQPLGLLCLCVPYVGRLVGNLSHVNESPEHVSSGPQNEGAWFYEDQHFQKHMFVQFLNLQDI